MVSNTIVQQKEKQAPDSRTIKGNLQDEPGISCDTRGQYRTQYNTHAHVHMCVHNDGNMSKGHKWQMEELLMAKAVTTWEIKNILLLDYNSKYK